MNKNNIVRTNNINDINCKLEGITTTATIIIIIITIVITIDSNSCNDK